MPSEALLYHSGLSMAINVGLLLPADVIARVIDVKGSANSKEAYLRQLLGWREYALCYYQYT